METRRIELTSSQAQELADIYRRKQHLEREWSIALKMIGTDPASIVAGNLDDDPHLMVEDDDAGSA